MRMLFGLGAALTALVGLVGFGIPPAATGAQLGDTAVATVDSSTASDLPTQDQLKAALLDPGDVGFKKDTNSSDDDDSNATGCPAFNSDSGQTASGQVTQAEVSLKAGDSGPFLSEYLATENPRVLAAGYAALKKELASCRTLKFSEGGADFNFELSPIKFGGPDSMAFRMDGDVNGISLNGYFGYELFGPVLLGFFYFQVFDGSSMVASTDYKLAVAKVHRMLPQTNGAPSSSALGKLRRPADHAQAGARSAGAVVDTGT
ncbi:hypothetical protein [Streptomyces sp. CA-111067]|uniref:hypothetical protein n=1 Tax=Streptomyces sp. CA-111067 TaxID=3240046 RepID=UPI003D968F06